ncbi:phospholipase C [Dyella sp. SG562]|uniref:phosphocholine-specific phospholipase C n=1 Tax=Dyella sp. SG562 TaxID=2587017 RepID=UPI00141E97A0|nr:phospholipase C, phosphocholine-specific [Dyella sp. SG562]NII74728.1 phospholipase C [Dyella sp. SG562]
MKRRDFMKLAGASLGASAMLGMPFVIRRAFGIEAHRATGTIADIEHVVILMQENRSFDHYFGSLRGVRGFGDRFPIPVQGQRRVWSQQGHAGMVEPFHLDGDSMNAALIRSMPHSYPDAQAAWGQGRMDQWPRFKTPASMGYYTRKEAPFQYALADAFTICDAYHCSVMGATTPNRVVFWSGSALDPGLRTHGAHADDGTAEIGNVRGYVTGSLPSPGYTYQGTALPWKTLPELLEQAGVSWKTYQHPNDNWNGVMHGGLSFEGFRSAHPGSPLYRKGMSEHSLHDLANDVMRDALPSVSWIVPTALQSEHPGASSSAGRAANFVERILRALTANPKSWSRTALFITYDENDGFFDHMPPPAIPSVHHDGSFAGASTVSLDGMYFNDHAGKYLHPGESHRGPLRVTGLGPRVPMFVVSPWSKGGWVNSQVFDHTSMAMFLERRFGIHVDAISPWHRAVCGDLTTAFDFTGATGEFPPLPPTAGYEQVEQRARKLPAAAPPGTPSPRLQEPGTRPSRALPYDADVALTQADGSLTLRFGNRGGQGVVMQVYDKLHLERVPRRYTIEAGKQWADTAWHPLRDDEGRFDLEVFGPNGFFRSFKGTVAEAASHDIDLQVRFDLVREEAVLEAHNASGTPARLAVKSLAYRELSAEEALPAGETRRYAWRLADSGPWYDFLVDRPGMTVRVAGRLETGRHATSDPA